MADRAGGLPKKRGCGSRLSRKHSTLDLVGERTKVPNLIEEKIWPCVFIKGVNEKRAIYPKTQQELLLGTGWKWISKSTILANCKYPTLIGEYFFIELPITYSRSNEKYFTSSCRLYLGKIEMPKCKQAHRCAVLDISSENPYRKGTQRKPLLELVVEEICSCFNEKGRDHEGTLILYRWR